MDSNQRMQQSKCCALPLGDTPMVYRTHRLITRVHQGHNRILRNGAGTTLRKLSFYLLLVFDLMCLPCLLGRIRTDYACIIGSRHLPPLCTSLHHAAKPLRLIVVRIVKGVTIPVISSFNLHLLTAISILPLVLLSLPSFSLMSLSISFRIYALTVIPLSFACSNRKLYIGSLNRILKQLSFALPF